MIRAYSKELVTVDKLYQRMIEDEIKPDVVTYTTMIDVNAKSGKIERAIEVFESMKKDGITSSVVTYTVR